MVRSNSENDSLRLAHLDDVIESKLLEKRRLFLSGVVTGESMTEAIRKLWYLSFIDSKTPIIIVINSPGGSVDDGMAMWDQIRALSCPVYTVVTGMAASMGSVLSVAAGKGKRFATPNARIMIHQPSISGVVRGQASDLEIHAREILKTKARLVDLYVEATGQARSIIEKAIDRDHWMSAQEAMAFGLLDGIVTENLDSLV